MRGFASYRWTASLLAALVLLVAGGCASDKQVISQAQEVHGGLQPAVINDANLTAYIQKVGDRIIDTAKEMDQQHYGPDSHFAEDSAWMFTNKMQFHFVASDELNAFTTGGEHMYVYTQLFLSCRSEDELAAVMAHEFAHVYCRHVQKGMNRQYAILGASVAAGGAGYALADKDNRTEYAAGFAGAALAAGQFVGMGFTRSDEDQADELGFQFYCHAGWNPAHFADFFQQMIDKGYDTTPAMMSDHPTLKSRVDQVKQWVAKLPPTAKGWRKPPTADAAQFRALQQKAAAIAKSLPNDKSLTSAKTLLASFPSCVSPTQTKTQKSAQEQIRKLLGK